MGEAVFQDGSTLTASFLFDKRTAEKHSFSGYISASVEPQVLPPIVTVYIPIPTPNSISRRRTLPKVPTTNEMFGYLKVGRIFEIVTYVVADLATQFPAQFLRFQQAVTTLFPETTINAPQHYEPIEWLIRENGSVMQFFSKGSGFQTGVTILACVYWVQAVEPGLPFLLALDEPTAFMHEKVALNLIRQLQALPSVQVILSSHSLSLLSALPRTNIVSFEGPTPMLLSEQVPQHLDYLRDQLSMIDLSLLR